MESFLQYYLPEFGVRLVEHLQLVMVATGVATLLGILLGIGLARCPRLVSPVMGVTSVIWTIPSLALLSFLLPIMGIGAAPAMTALTLYALLPIVRNTLTGLHGVAKEVIEAAHALGFTAWQRLIWVEFPLAFPAIIAGIRTAVTIAMGTAPLGAFIGAGGLGEFINRGLAVNDNRLILLGAIPATVLALGLDCTLSKVVQVFSQGKRFKLRPMVTVGVSALSVLLMISIVLTGWTVAKPTVRLGSKNSTEQLILGEMMAQLIEKKTQLKVERQFNLGTTDIVHRALIKGEIDLYPEYTGTAYLTLLHQTPGPSAAEIYRLVKTVYQEQFGLVWLSPLGFNNSQAVVVRQKFAKQHRLQKISDLAAVAPRLTLAGPAELVVRPDGLPILEKAYQLNFAAVKSLNNGLLYDALRDRQVDVIMAATTDARVPAYHLQVLYDDQRVFPAYCVAPVVRAKVLRKHPELSEVLHLLAGLLDEHTMQQLNYQVDILKQPPAQVAQAFLRQKRL